MREAFKALTVMMTVLSIAYCQEEVILTKRSELAAQATASTPARLFNKANEIIAHEQAGFPTELLLPFAEKAADLAAKPASVYVDFVTDHLRGFLTSLSGRGPAFKDKARPLIVAVENPTQDSYRLETIYFDSGRSFDHPMIGSILGPGQTQIFYFANKDGSWFTGCSGAIQYRGLNGRPTFSVGWSHPYAGSIKANGYFGTTQLNAYKCLVSTVAPGVMYKGLEGVPTVHIDTRYVPRARSPFVC